MNEETNCLQCVEIKEEKERDNESDDEASVSSFDLMQKMYESLKDAATTSDTKPSRNKSSALEKKRDYHLDDLPSDIEPDRSKTDYYCKICDAHMNSVEMWEAHVSGKRHLKNIQKPPGEMPSKLRSIKVKAAPQLLEAIKGVNKPIVGLQYMTELQRSDPSLRPSYSCHLCQAHCTWSVVTDHILTTKHRLAFLKAVDPEQYKMIISMGLSPQNLGQLAEDRAREFEAKKGCGEIEVKLEKPKISLPQPMQNTTYEVSEISERYSPHPSPVRKEIRSRSSSRESSISPSTTRYTSHSPSYRRKRLKSPEGKWRHDRYFSSGERSPPPRRASRHISESEIRRFVRLSSSDKIKLITRIVHSIESVSVNMAEEVIKIISYLTAAIVNYKIRELPSSKQIKLANYIKTNNRRKCEHYLMPYITDILDSAHNIDLSSDED